MKNNKNIKILLPTVILLWGILIYKIVDAFNPEQLIFDENATSNFVAPEAIEKDVFSLLAIDKDPFLGTLQHENQNITATSQEQKQEINWPNVRFMGIVSNQSNTASIYIIEVDGIQQLFKKGEKLNNLKIIHGDSQEVTVSYRGLTKQFPIM